MSGTTKLYMYNQVFKPSSKNLCVLFVRPAAAGKTPIKKRTERENRQNQLWLGFGLNGFLPLSLLCLLCSRDKIQTQHNIQKEECLLAPGKSSP